MNKNKLDSMLKTIDTFKHEPIYIGNCSLVDIATMLRQQQEKLTKYELRHAEQRKRIDELEAEIEALKAENKFFKDLMGDVEILRKAQEK